MKVSLHCSPSGQPLYDQWIQSILQYPLFDQRYNQSTVRIFTQEKKKKRFEMELTKETYNTKLINVLN